MSSIQSEMQCEMQVMAQAGTVKNLSEPLYVTSMRALQQMVQQYGRVEITRTGMDEVMVRAGGRSSFHPNVARAIEDRARIDTEAVAARLDSGVIGGAALDSSNRL